MKYNKIKKAVLSKKYQYILGNGKNPNLCLISKNLLGIVKRKYIKKGKTKKQTIFGCPFLTILEDNQIFFTRKTTSYMTSKPLLEDWRTYCQHLTSPNSFIDMGFYYMIASALQRRVWVGSCEMPIFPNMYIILVGEPGIGKGLVIKPVTSFMMFHKERPIKKATITEIDSEETTNELQRNIKELQELLKSKNTRGTLIPLPDERLLFPVPADATTYQALIKSNSNAHRHFMVPKELRKYSIVPPSGVYGHSSQCFLLEELSSLFQKKADNTVDYLLTAWDCGDYRYESIGRGLDKVSNTCLSLLAGTTPGFMRDTFNDKLIDEGLSARTIFVFEQNNRKFQFGIPDLNEEQIAAKAKVLARLRELSTLFGQATYTPEAWEFFKHYFEKELPLKRINNSAKLNPYYSKKVQHAQKLAMAIHFVDSNEMEIGVESCQKSLEILAGIESRMHFALSQGSKSMMGVASKRIVRFLMGVSEPQTMQQIWYDLDGDIKDTELLDILRYLISTDQIEKIENKYKIKKKV